MITAFALAATLLAQAPPPGLFIHRAGPQNTAGASTRLDGAPAGRRGDWVLAVTQNWNPGGGGGVYNPHPVGIRFAGGVWEIVNLDGAPMPAGAGFNVLAMPPGPRAFVHAAAAENLSNNWTTLAAEAKGQTLLVTPVAGEATEARAVGLWATGGRWAIFNQDRQAMRPGSRFHVVDLPGSTHAAAAANVAGHITTTDVQQGDAGAIVFLAPVFAGPYVESPLGIYWDGGRWKLFAQDRRELPVSSAFNLVAFSSKEVQAAGSSAPPTVPPSITHLPPVEPPPPVQPPPIKHAPPVVVTPPVEPPPVKPPPVTQIPPVVVTPPVQTPPVQPPPVRPPVVPPLHIPPAVLTPPPAAPNWDFSQGTLGWEKTGTAFDNQPTVGDNVYAARIGVGKIGGDYFNVPYPIGNNGKPWIGTYENRPDDSQPLGTVQGDEPQGTLTSPPFPVAKGSHFFSFLIGGGNDVERLGVALLVEGRGAFGPTKFRATGLNCETMRREVWDLSQLVGHRAKVVVRDLSSGPWGHTNVADFRTYGQDPRPRLARAEVAPGVSGLVDPETPVFGLADLHAHPAAHLAFGGNLYAGRPLGRMASSLGTCESNHRKSPTEIHPGPAEGFFIAIGNAFGDLFGGMGAFFSGNINAFKDKLYEIDGPLHSGVGYPALQSWRYYNRLHEHMHVDWIRRAYDGGLRLMVADAVHNTLLAEIDPQARRELIRDRESADAQIEYIKRMAGECSEWMEIAYDPGQARDIIRRGKLAVVLGIEVDAIGNLRRPTAEQLDAELDRLFGLGVRHVFPIHLADSVFGGCAIYGDMFNLNNYYLNSRLFRIRDGQPAGTEFRLDAPRIDGAAHHVNLDLNLGSQINMGDLAHAYDAARPTYERYVGHANAMGLSDVGRSGIQKLMSLGMLIDIDHMSALSLDEVVTMAERRAVGDRRGYPVMSGHTTFRALGRGLSERNWSRDSHALSQESSKGHQDAVRIAALGGMFAPITCMNDCRKAAGSPVESDASGTSKDLAQSIHYAVQMSLGRGVGIGTDLAMLGGFGPRFGTDACPAMVMPEKVRDFAGATVDARGESRDGVLDLRRAQARAQGAGVRYDSPIRDYRRYRFFWTHGNTGRPIYTERQRDFWEALAIWDSGTDPERADQPDILNNRSLNTMAVVKAFAHGLRADSPAQVAGRGGIATYYAEKRAAFLARHPEQEGHDPGGPEEGIVREILADVRPIWDLWQRMKNASHPAPIKRLVYEGIVNEKPYVRDFDINIDGFAHYGMLPDALQDLKNVGLQERHFQAMFKSAEEFLRMWERCWAMRSPPAR